MKGVSPDENMRLVEKLLTEDMPCCINTETISKPAGLLILCI
jgi:hypothetical protein